MKNCTCWLLVGVRYLRWPRIDNEVQRSTVSHDLLTQKDRQRSMDRNKSIPVRIQENRATKEFAGNSSRSRYRIDAHQTRRCMNNNLWDTSKYDPTVPCSSRQWEMFIVCLTGKGQLQGSAFQEMLGMVNVVIFRRQYSRVLGLHHNDQDHPSVLQACDVESCPLWNEYPSLAESCYTCASFLDLMGTVHIC
jgi:hypothetical protein